MAEKLMVVIPCYNEEEVLPETSRRLVLKMGSLVEKGLISAGEYDRIMAENRRVFSPYLADLYPDNALL